MARDERGDLDIYAGEVDALKYAGPVDEVSARLRARGLAFQFGGVASVIETQESAVFRKLTDRNLPASTTQVVRASPGNLRRSVEAVSTWTRYDAREKKRVAKPVPSWLLQQIIDEGGAGLAPLSGVADHPVFHAGELLAGRIGYHPPTRLFIDCAPCEVEPWPTPEDALHFLAEVWLRPFPFRTDADRLRALFLPLTLLTRRTMIRGGAPLVFITAPQRLSGKTLLSSCAFFAVTGREPPTLPFPKREELAKVLFAALLEGGPALLFDNVPDGFRVKDANLDRYATSDTYSDRILGLTEVRHVPALATLVPNGNNIEPGGDTASRSYEIRLERTFAADEALRGAMDFTRNNRPRILGALAAVLRTEPQGQHETRFLDWEKTVAWPVVALSGARDLLAGMVAASHVTDGGDEDLAVLLACMAEKSTDWMFAAELMADDKCHAALALLIGRGAPVTLEARHLGKQLRKWRDLPAGGFRLRVGKRYSETAKKEVDIWIAELM